jgi:hypothetical protein
MAGGSLAARAQTPLAHPATAKTRAEKVRDDTSTVRSPELTLANLRPGRHGIARAERLFSKPESTADSGSSQLWRDLCASEVLSVITDGDGMIQQVTVAKVGDADPRGGIDFRRNCGAASSRVHWSTSRGLAIGDRSDRILALYGQPGSRGPSTQGGQKLELFYYAFDWAGPDVPQVMTVLCTPDKEGKAGRVVEITLAAPSL